MESTELSSDFLCSLSKDKVLTFLNNFPDGVIFSDESGNILFLNQEMKDIFGYSTGEIVGRPIESVISSEAQENISNSFSEPVHVDSSVITGRYIEAKAMRKDGSYVPLEMSHHLIKENGNELNFFLIRNMSQQFELQEKLYQQTITDSLTGLFNRRYFDERIKQEFHRASRYQRLFSVVIIDIDGFKQANDLLGHSFGDEMLVKATDIFREVLRDGDTVYRYGGDEFAMILPETTKEGALDVSERLREIFAKKCCVKEKRVSLTLSIGVASHPEDGNSEFDLIGAADRRMYQSKQNGGNNVTGYNLNESGDSDDDALIILLTKLIHLVEKNREWKTEEGICHSQEIRALGVDIGRKIGLSPSRLHLYEQAAMLHDIGTIHIPSSIFNKREKLTESEIGEIRKHTQVGEEILGLLDNNHNQDLAELKKIVSQHHEWVDGNGYPYGLKSDEIMIEAKILAVTDAYSAMRMARSYRPQLSTEEIVKELKGMAGKQFDPEIVDVLLALLGLGESQK